MVSLYLYLTANHYQRISADRRSSAAKGAVGKMSSGCRCYSTTNGISTHYNYNISLYIVKARFIVYTD